MIGESYCHCESLKVSFVVRSLEILLEMDAIDLRVWAVGVDALPYSTFCP